MASLNYDENMVVEPLYDEAIRVSVDSDLALLSDYTDELAQVVNTNVSAVEKFDVSLFSRLLHAYYLHLLFMRVNYVNGRRVAIPPKNNVFTITPHMCAILEKLGRVENEDKALVLTPEFTGPPTLDRLLEVLKDLGVTTTDEGEAIMASSRWVKKWLRMAGVTTTTVMPVSRDGDPIFMWLQVMKDRSVTGDSHTTPKATALMALTAGITQTANLYKPTVRYCSRGLGRRLLQMVATLEVAHER